MDELPQLPHKLKLLEEVALELSQGKDEKVVMWVFDSFSTLVWNANRDISLKSYYSGVIATIFSLNKSMIPVAVCSSATTAGELNSSELCTFCLLLFSFYVCVT